MAVVKAIILAQINLFLMIFCCFLSTESWTSFSSRQDSSIIAMDPIRNITANSRCFWNERDEIKESSYPTIAILQALYYHRIPNQAQASEAEII